MTFRHSLFTTMLLFLGLCSAMGQTQKKIHPGWTHYSIDPILPGSSWGTGGPALADYDGDGDLDVAISRRNT